MLCPRCKAEFREGIDRCPDCEVALVERVDEVVELTPLGETASPGELEGLLGALEDARIPYVVQAGTALSLLDGAIVEASGLPEPWGARVWVLGSRLAEARRLRSGPEARERGGSARFRPEEEEEAGPIEPR